MKPPKPLRMNAVSRGSGIQTEAPSEPAGAWRNSGLCFMLELPPRAVRAKLPPENPMHKRRLGRTDLLVSQICLGSMTWGQQNTEAEGHAQMDLAFSRGVNSSTRPSFIRSRPRPRRKGGPRRPSAAG